jgi:hypothetical protein
MAASRVLLVEPDAGVRAALVKAIGPCAEVDPCSDFSTARERLRRRAYDRIITNLRLRRYNGLHLVYLARPNTRSVVYTVARETSLTPEVQRAGAFYEWYGRLRYSAASYVQPSLPAADRRTAIHVTRRVAFRGGRRCSDVTAVHGSGA